MHNRNEMTPRERLLSALRGQETDRIPWAPFLAYWWEAQSDEFQKQGDVRFLQEIGADPLLRGAAQLYQVTGTGTETTETLDGRRKHSVIRTPVGTLSYVHTFVPTGNTWFLTEHPVKNSEDLKTLQWMNEHLTISPSPQGYRERRTLLGEDALIIPIIGTYMKSSFQSLVEHWIGTENLTYMLADDPDAVEECLAVMQARSEETVRISTESEAEAFIFWEDSSTTNITPAWFSRYAAPEISRWADIIHDAGKLLIHHACGHLRDLLPLMAATGADSIESISPPPTGNIEIWEARAMLPESVGLIGGIEPTAFLHSSDTELEAYVHRLVTKMSQAGMKSWILANSDSCPPGVTIEKFRSVTRLVKGVVRS